MPVDVSDLALQRSKLLIEGQFEDALSMT